MKESQEINIFPLQVNERNNLQDAQKKVEIYIKNEEKKENNAEILNDKERHEVKGEKEKYEEELDKLLKDKKDKLQNKFEGLSNKFKNFGDTDIYSIIKKYNSSDEDEANESVDDDFDNNEEIINAKKRQILDKRCCNIYIFATIFIIFYLVGIFQLLDLFDTTKKRNRNNFQIIFLK